MRDAAPLSRPRYPRPLPRDFYDRPVFQVARELIGCVFSHRGCAGVIVETEAYHDSDPACHAFAGLTPRTQTLFGLPGHAYVYRSYGIHAMLNAVCELEGVGAAALIRALEPIAGIELMFRRRATVGLRSGSGRAPVTVEGLCSGPGKLTQALGIELSDNGCDLSRGPVVISEPPADRPDVAAAVDRRIGITKATDLPWRFCAVGSRFLSRPARRVSAAARV